VSAYTYGFIFFQLPHGLVAVSVMTTLLPALSAAASDGDLDTYRARFGEGFRLLTVVMLPAAVGLGLLGRPLVSGLLQNGAFTGASSELTGDVVMGLAVGLPGFSLYLYVLRGFYARRDTKTPFQLNVLQNGANIVLAVLVVDRWGVGGLALAYSIAYAVAALAALLALDRRVNGLVGGREITTVLRTGVAAAVMAAVLWGLRSVLDDEVAALAVLAAGVVGGGATFVAVGAALRIPELRQLRSLARSGGSD
jgi:putative peptidoglycan lipid II flippase